MANQLNTTLRCKLTSLGLSYTIYDFYDYIVYRKSDPNDRFVGVKCLENRFDVCYLDNSCTQIHDPKKFYVSHANCETNILVYIRSHPFNTDSD